MTLKVILKIISCTHEVNWFLLGHGQNLLKNIRNQAAGKNIACLSQGINDFKVPKKLTLITPSFFFRVHGSNISFPYLWRVGCDLREI